MMIQALLIQDTFSCPKTAHVFNYNYMYTRLYVHTLRAHVYIIMIIKRKHTIYIHTRALP